jgi:oligoendopeptidase F
MFVFALYERHLQEGKNFVPKLKNLLSAGGSMSPLEIGKSVGLDVSSPDFWQLGLKRFEFFVDELQGIVK